MYYLHVLKFSRESVKAVCDIFVLKLLRLLVGWFIFLSHCSSSSSQTQFSVIFRRCAWKAFAGLSWGTCHPPWQTLACSPQ